jgi:hypothetical protein
MFRSMPSLTIESVPLDSIIRHPANARTHNLDIIKESLRTHGQFLPLLVQLSTKFILAGNGRHEGMEQLGWPEADVTFIDVDDEQATKILLVDNRSSDTGDYRDAELVALLESLNDLVGTGYDSIDLDDLLAQAQETSEEITRNMVDNEEDNLDSWAQGYLAKTIRTILLDYEGETYLWMVDRLNELRFRYQVNTNAEAVLRLLADKFPNQPPPEPKE